MQSLCYGRYTGQAANVTGPSGCGSQVLRQHGSRGVGRHSPHTARCGVNKSCRLQSATNYHRGRVTIPAKEDGREDKEQRIRQFRRAPSKVDNYRSNDGQVIVVQAADLLQSRRVIPDLATWSQCYALFVAVLAPHQPERLPELMAYQSLIANWERPILYVSAYNNIPAFADAPMSPSKLNAQLRALSELRHQKASGPRAPAGDIISLEPGSLANLSAPAPNQEFAEVILQGIAEGFRIGFDASRC